jgi:uncharacterized membrane protein
MQGIKRKIVYVTLFEGIAIVCATVGLAVLSGNELGHSGVLAIATSVVAVLWNFGYTTLFEAWETRRAVRGRGLARRVAHTLGFEIGLIALLVPLIAWWFRISLTQALLLDLGLVGFFLAYTFSFTWAFDRVFGLPDSAAERLAQAN